MLYQPYFDEEAYSKAKRQNRKEKNKAQKTVDDLYDILNPHKFMDDESIYGENNVLQLLNIAKINTNAWPEITHNNVASSNMPDITSAYKYKEKFRSQIYQYMQYAIKEKGFSSYDDIKNADNLIDISKEYPVSDDRSKPNIQFNEDELQTLKNMKHKAFIPCFDECVIRLNKRKFLHCKLIEKNDKNTAYTYQLRMYCGDNKNWILDQALTVKFNFEKMTNDKLPMHFDVINALSYEEFITMYMEELNWSDKEKTFWRDMLSTSPFNQITMVDLLQEEFGLNATIYVTSPQKLHRLENICREINVKLSVVTSNEDEVRANFEPHVVKELIPIFFKTVATINAKINNCNTTQKYEGSLPTDKQTNVMYYKVADKDNKITRYVRKIKIQSAKESNMTLPKQLQS